MAGIFLGSVYATLEMKTQQFQSAIANAKSGFGGAAGASKVFAKAVAASSVVAGAAMVYAGKQAMDFETQMTDVSTLIAGDSTKAVDTLRSGILDLTKQIPKSADELGASAYAIMSAGITDSAEALKVLESSAKLAVAGLGTTEEATNLMTSAINSFSAEGLSASQISDILFKTVKNGKTTVSDLSSGFGAIAGQVADSGTKMEDFMSVVSALTTVGVPASQAYTQMRAVMAGLTRETETSKEVFDALGVKTFKELIKKSGGMGKAMQALKAEVGDNDAKMLKLVGSTEALAAITSIAGPTAEAYANTLDDMGNSAYGVEQAFEKQKATAASALQLLKNELNATAITLGNKLLPYVTQFVNFLTGTMIPAIKSVVGFLSRNKIVLAAIAGAILGGLVPAFIAWAAVMITTTIPAIIAAIIALAPFILAGAAIGAIAFLIMKNWDTLKGWFFTAWNAIKTAFTTAFEFIKSNWQIFAIVLTGGIGALVVLFITHWNTIKNVAMTVFNAIKAVVLFVFNAIVVAIQVAWSIIEPIFNVIKAVATFVFQVILVVAAAVFIAIAVAFKALWTIGKAIFNAWLAVATTIFNGIKAVATAVFNAVSGAVQWAWNKIRPILSTIGSFASSIFNGVKSVASSVFNAVWGFVKTAVDKVIGFFKGMGSAIGGAMSTVADTIMSPFKSAFNAVAGFWNNTVGKISFNAPDWVPGIGGKGFSMPTIPTLASGGIATKATLAMIGEGGESEAILPLSRLESMLPSLRNSQNGLPNVDGNQNGGMGDTINIDRLELPSVQNPDDFVRDMKLKLASMRGL